MKKHCDSKIGLTFHSSKKLFYLSQTCTKYNFFYLQAAARNSHNQKGYTLLGFGQDFSQDGRGEILTSLQLNVQPVAACSKQYNKILNDPTDDLHELVSNALPEGFEEDSLICAQIPGKSEGSCPGDSGGILMSNDWIPELEDFRAVQKAVVQGSAKACDGGRYPTIFNRLDDSETLSWIHEIVFPKSKSNYLL